MDEQNLHEYQREAVKHILDHRYCGLFLDMGLGKTVSTLTAIKILMFEELEISSVLIVAPKRVAESVWDEEVRKWSHLNCIRVSKIVGSEKQRTGALHAKADIYTIGRDNIPWLCAKTGGKLPFDMLVIDELSSFKNPKSIRFKALRSARPYIKRVVGLTGTPAPNGLIDLWSQMFLLDQGERLGKFITHYRNDFFVPGKRNGPVVYSYNLQKNGEERIYDKIKDICLSMRAKDYLSLPGKMVNTIKLSMPPELQKKYDSFEKEQVLSLMSDGEEKEISAINAAALSTKLLQYANGAIYDESGNAEEIHQLKIDAVKEIVEDSNGQSVLIAWTYRHDRDRLMEALKKYGPKELKGQKEIDDWNSGKIQVLLMHPASGGHGLNLQAGGHIIIWFGQTWSLELEEQFNARLDRQGQRFPIVINKLIASRTIDEDVISAQERKRAGQNGLMEAIKLRIEKYYKKKL